MTGFSNVGKRLIDEMRNLGVTISTTATAFPNLEDLSEENEVRLRVHQVIVIHRMTNKPYNAILQQGDMVTAFNEIEEIQESMRSDLPLEVVAEAPESEHSLSADTSKPTAADPNHLVLSFFSRMRTKLGKFVLKQYSHSSLDTRREFSEQIVKLQDAEHTDRAKIFHWVRLGDLTALKEKILKDRTIDISAVDAAGANIVHLAYLFEFYHLGHWLVESYPNLALRPYSDRLPPELEDMGYSSALMPFTGENILHVVIVRRNYKEVRWLLDFFKDHKDRSVFSSSLLC